MLVRTLNALLGLAAAALFVGATAADAQFGRDPVGTYYGTCLAQYDGTQAAPCNMTLYVDQAYGVTVPANANCVSPTPFYGILEGNYASLYAGPWAAQTRGQTLDISFSRRAGVWTASGSGGGVADTKWSYRCSFRMQ
jgi:hypothetical protein